MNQQYTLFFLLLFLSKMAFSQSWAIHLNGNETYPIGNDLKTYHPILWYSSDDDRGVIVGGFGAGVSYSKPWKEKVSLRFQLNAQRSRFYDAPTVFQDENGAPLGAIIGINTNWNASAFGLAVFPFWKKFDLDFGIGLGARGTFLSKTDYGEAYVQGEKTSLKLKNKSLAPAVAILPIELSKKFGSRFTASTRAEFALTSVSRLEVHSNEKSMVLFGEISYRLGE